VRPVRTASIAAFSLAVGLAVAAPVASLTQPRPAPSLLGPICHGEPQAPIAGPHRLVMLAGMGDDHMTADTRSPEAQRWFDYGLTLARSFEHRDAALAFQRAAAVDPHCSLCLWGEAWARGPTINVGADPGLIPSLLAEARAAKALAAPKAPPRIRALEAALVDRYAAASAEDGDLAFAHAMDALHKADPDDVEDAIFDAEAWLVMENDGEAGGATIAMQALQPLLPKHPDASGLIHFYVHATENAGVPQLAEPYADRLAQLAPMASHMVHMPSHTYYRVGRYEDAALANLAALRVDQTYAEKTDFPTPLGDLMYHFHDIQFGIAGAMMAGDAAAGLQLVSAFNRDFPSPAAYDPRQQIAAGQIYAALGRFAAPADVLAAPDTVAASPFLEAMRHYARGEAYLRLGRPGDARTEAALVAAPPAAVAPLSRNGAVLQIARLTLLGDAALQQHRAGEAIAAFRPAAELQEARLAKDTDPPAWWYPVRRSLAAALLAKRDAKGAEREATAVLQTWQLDPVTLAIRAAARQALREPDAAADLTAAQAGWHGDPAQLTAAAAG
jgi:tetratricopeptide (TPR) repeat protein